MSNVFADRVLVNTSTTGQGTLTLGTALPGFRTFAEAGITIGQTVSYVISQPPNYEVGTGTYNADNNTLTRTLQNSSTGQLINLTSEGATVAVVFSAEDIGAIETSIDNLTTTVNSIISWAPVGYSNGIAFSGGYVQLAANLSTGNVTIGTSAGGAITTGNGDTFVGYKAGQSNTSGGSNSFFGFQSGYQCTTGGLNSVFGAYAGESITTGANNSAFGYLAGQVISSGSSNAFFGGSSGINTTTGGYNTFVGSSAGGNCSTGGSNAFFGYGAGGAVETGTANTAVGANAGPSADISHSISIGHGAAASASYQLAIGSSSDPITTASTATAGAAALPGNPLGFLVVNLNGALVKLPYYSP